MVRYYKLLHYGDGLIVYDFSKYEVHYKFRVINSLDSIWVTDPEMEKQIAFASTKAHSDPDFFKLAVDDFTNSQRFVRKPAYPLIYSNLNVEFWFKFIPPADITPYEFVFIHDQTNPSNFKIYTLPGNTTAICYKIIGATDCSQFSTSLLINTGRKALGAHWSAMIGYWPLTPESFGFNFLLDYSMNSQLVALPSNLKFRGEYDDSLTLCKPEWAYDNTKKICIELASLTTQTAPDFYQNGQWVFKLDSNGKINVALELWFYPIFQNFTIFRKEDSLLTVKGFQNLSPLQNGIILEKSQIPSLNALTNYPYAPGHWTHLMVQSKNLGGGNIQYNVCICRVCYDPMVLTSGATLNANALIAEFYQGSIREVRVWDISLYNGFSFFYKRQILYPQEEETLLDYWRMEADDNNVYTHYNNPLGFLYLQNYHIAPNIPVALYPKLGECKYGASFSGYSCQYNDIIPENINTASSIEIITINQTTPLPSYSVGFWFKFPNQIDQNIVCGIPPDPKNFIFLSLETQSTVQYLMLRQNGCEFTVALTSTFFSQKWYQIVATKWDVSSTLTCPNYAFANGTGFGSVILGCGVNMQKGASVRNFFLTPYAMSQNDVILTTRVSWKMLKFRMISYIPFNETRNDWFYDIANPFLIGNYRNGQGHYLVHDSYLPIICDDLYESMNFDTQMCDQKKIANFAQNQEILLQVGKLNSVWNPNYQMCFGFYLRVLHQDAQQYKIFDYGNSDFGISTAGPLTGTFNFDQQILIGKSLLPTFQGLSGLMRQLTIFSKQCTQNDVYLMMTIESTEQYLLAHYFTFEENTYHGKIYDYGWAASPSYSQQNINTLSFDSYQTYDQFNWDYTQEVWAFGTYPIYTGLVLPSSVNWCLNFNFYSFDDWSIADKILFVLTNFIKITRLSNGQFEFIFYPSNFSTKSAVTHYLPIDRWHTFGLSRTAVGSTTDMYMFIDDIQYIVLDGKDMPAVTSDIQTASSGLAIREIKISLNRNDLVKNFALPVSQTIIPDDTIGCVYYQLDFWVLFIGNVDPGDLIRELQLAYLEQISLMTLKETGEKFISKQNAVSDSQLQDVMGSGQSKPLENIFKRPLASEVYMYYELQTKNKDDWIIYDLSSTNYSNRLLMKGAGSQKFKWWLQKEIFTDAEELVLCSQDEEYHYIQARCQPAIVETIRFSAYYGTNQTVLKNTNPQISYNNDWTIDLWVNFKFQVDIISTSMTLIKSNCYTDMSQIAYNLIVSRTSSSKQCIMNFHFQDYGGTGGLIQEDRDISELKWIHVAVVNRFSYTDKTLKLYAQAQQPQTQNIATARSKFPSCDIVIGAYGSPVTAPNHYFYLKDLRIWNIAHNLQTIKKIAFEKSYYVGELNLVRYYRFNVFGLEDVINGKGVSDYIQGANMISGVYDSTFNMECPYGYMFNNNTGSCYGKYLTVFDNNIIATRYFQNLQQNTRVSWSNYHHIASVAEDHDLSFTMLLWTVSDANGGLDFFFIEDILEIFEFNKTHQFSFLRDGLPSISRTSVQPLSKVYISWAFMYDGESNKFMIFMEDQEIASVEIPYDELPKSSSWVTDFGALNSYRNTSMYLVRYAFFQGTISKNIITKSAKAYSDPIESTPALKSMLLFEQSNFDKFTNQYNPYDYANRDLEQSYTTHPTQKPYWAIQTINCKPGTIFNYLNCLLPQSLVLNNATQYLDTTGVKLGYSATVQFWFNIVQEGNPSQPTTLFSMQNTIFINKLGPDFTFNWANFQTPGTLSQVLNTGVLNSNQWYQHTFVLYLRRICYYQDYNLINNFTDPNYQWDSVSISYIGISAPASYKIKYKEISIMGYPKSQAEIIRDRFQTIDYYMYYQSLLVYFPINESIYNKIYDLSKYARITDLLNSGVYWDFEAKSTYATNLNSQTGNDAQTKDKALFFHHGLTTPVVLPYTNLDISSIDYTLMFCFNIQSLNDIPINTKVTVIEVEYLASIILMKYSNSHVGIFYEYYPGSMPFLTLDHYLMNQWQCLIATMFGSDNFTYFMNPDVNSVGNGNSLMVNAFSFPNITASQRQIIINPFNVYLREIKLFNVGLSIGNAIRLYRQSINSQLYWGKYLASYYRMDEGFGLDILNYKNAQYFTIPDNYVGGKIAPMWSDPGSKLIICDAESKYSQTGYCQSREKFLQLPETSNHIAHLNLLDFQNITLAVWLYIKQFDNQMSGITIRHEQKYKIEINTDKSVRYTLGDYPTQSLDTRNVLRLKSWFVIFTMINKDEDFSQCSFIYSNGVSSFDHKSKKISKPWRYSSSLNVDDFYIDVSSGTKVFARDLQIWNAPLSLESFMNFRMHRGLDPISLRRQMLILYFRFDESAGQYYLSNTAQQYRHGNVWNYFKPISGENKWYYYSNLEADPTYDTETMRAQLFCREPYSLRIDTHCEYYGCDAGVQDGVCTGPQPNAYYTCNQTGNQVFSFYKRDCYDCYSNCATCNVANSFDSCTSCYSGQMLVNGICTNECPESLYYFNGTCVTCENALCKCTQENLSLCIACLNPSHYYLSDEMNCTDTVPIEQFYNEEQQVFQQCHPFCMTCDWSDQYSCLSCSNNTFDMGNKYCNSITCMDGSELLEPGIPPACTPCQAPCLTCKNLPSKCTSCDETTVLDDEGQCLPCSAIVGYDYPIKGSGASKKCTEICGDGLNFGQFPCDDGNKKDGDGCNSKCEIELQMTCGGGSPTSKDSCHDTVGPSVEIVAVSEQSKILTLQFRESQGQVFTKAKSLNESDFALIITGINGKLKYTVKAKISEQFSSTGKLTIDFNPQFSIPSQGAFVKIQFKKANQFVDQYDNHLQNTLTNKIQLKEYEFVDESTMGSIKAMGAAVSSGTTVILAVNFIASLLLDKALDAFYSALNSIQILYYLPLINIPFPQIMYTIFSYLSYATLENQLLEDPISQNINFQNIKDRPLNDAFENYNIESQVFLQLFKYKGGMLFLIFGPLPFVFILSRFKHRAFNIFKKMRKFYFFNGPLRFGYEMYLEMGIFAYLNLNNLQFKNRDQLIASTLAIIAITHITFFPLISMSLIQRFSHNFDDQYFKEKLSTLVEGTKLKSVLDYLNIILHYLCLEDQYTSLFWFYQQIIHYFKLFYVLQKLC
eukprot:403337750